MFNKKNLPLVIITCVILLFLLFAVFFYDTPSESDNDTNSSESQTSVSSISPQSEQSIVSSQILQSSDLPEGFVINNTMVPLEYMNATMDGDFVSLEFDLYCENNIEDIFACHESQPFQSAYVNLIVNDNTREVFQFFEYQTKVNTDISTVVDEYLVKLKERNTECAGGLLASDDQSRFVFALIAQGDKTQDSYIYSVLDTVAERENMGLIYSCH